MIEFNQFNIDACSHCDYEKMVLFINHGKKQFAIINSDNNEGRVVVEIVYKGEVISTLDMLRINRNSFASTKKELLKLTRDFKLNYSRKFY